MANGGIIGPDNKTSFGKNKVTKKTSSGTITTQPGTRLANVLVVAGGGGGGYSGGGGAGCWNPFRISAWIAASCIELVTLLGSRSMLLAISRMI